MFMASPHSILFLLNDTTCSPIAIRTQTIDRADVQKARDAFFHENMVRIQEFNVLKDKLMWCVRREGVNHLQNCKALRDQYQKVLRENKDDFLTPFRLPARQNESQQQE